MNRRWPFLGPEQYPLPQQEIWPAARAAIGSFLPPELRDPPRLQNGQPGTRRAPEPRRRSHDEASSGNRAALAASMLSQQLHGGAVARKAKQWEAVVASHRGGISSARPRVQPPSSSMAPPWAGLTQPPRHSSSSRPQSPRDRPYGGGTCHAHTPITASSTCCCAASSAAVAAGVMQAYGGSAGGSAGAGPSGTSAIGMLAYTTPLPPHTPSTAAARSHQAATAEVISPRRAAIGDMEARCQTLEADVASYERGVEERCGEAVNVAHEQRVGAIPRDGQPAARAVGPSGGAATAGSRATAGLPPPPPPRIQFAWAHPQRLLAGLAHGEYEWGRAEQRALERYVSQYVASVSGAEAEEERQARAADEAGDGDAECDSDEEEGGVGAETLLQLLGPATAEDDLGDANAAGGGGGASIDVTAPVQGSDGVIYPPPRPRGARPSSANPALQGVPQPPPPPPPEPAWVRRLAMGEAEKKQGLRL